MQKKYRIIAYYDIYILYRPASYVKCFIELKSQNLYFVIILYIFVYDYSFGARVFACSANAHFVILCKYYKKPGAKRCDFVFSAKKYCLDKNEKK